MGATIIGRLNSGLSGTNEIVDEYIVAISSESNWNSALGAPGLPVFGAVHGSRSGYYVMDITARPANEFNHYRSIVSVRYQPVKAQVSVSPTAPWDEPSSYSASTRAEAFYDGKYFDTDSNSWEMNANSAGDIYDPTQPREIHITEIVINMAKEAAGFSPAFLTDYSGKVNDGYLMVCGFSCVAYDLKLVGVSYNKKYWLNPSTGVLEAYFDITISIHKHPDSWKMAQLDAGFRQKNSDTGKLEMIMEPDPMNKNKDRIVQRMVKLDGNGRAMSSEDQADPETFTYLPPRLFSATANFSALNLPSGA